MTLHAGSPTPLPRDHVDTAPARPRGSRPWTAFVPAIIGIALVIVMAILPLSPARLRPLARVEAEAVVR